MRKLLRHYWLAWESFILRLLWIGFLESSKPGNFTRRQDCPKVWELNGAIYIINVDALKQGPIAQFSRIRKYVMDRYASIDIDNEIDWLVAEKILESGNFGAK